jgi:hypothetical protein
LCYNGVNTTLYQVIVRIPHFLWKAVMEKKFTVLRTGIKIGIFCELLKISAGSNLVIVVIKV